MGVFSFFNKKSNKKKYEQSEPISPRNIYNRSGGTVVGPNSSMKVSAFYSGVVYISTQVAKLPWYVKDVKNKKIYNSIYNLLNLAPNLEIDAMDLKLFLVQSAIIFGNGYAEIVRNKMGQIVELWPILSTDVQATRFEGQLVYRIVGGSSLHPGEDAYLRPQEIFHLKNFFTQDGFNGQGVVAYASEVLGIALGADRFANSLFANGGMPSGVLSAESSLSDTAAGRLKESWKTAHGGRKIGGTAVLEEGVKYTPISHDPQVLQFLESRQFSVLEIARFLRIPPTKLYDIQAAKFNNMEQENLSVATDILSSWTKRLEIQADIKLIANSTGSKRQHTDMDLNDLFRGDMDTRSQYFSRMMQNAAMTPNEIREAEGREPYNEGNEFYIATNNFSPISRMDEIIDSQIKSKDINNKDKDKDKEIDDSEKELNNMLIDYIKNKK